MSITTNSMSPSPDVTVKANSTPREIAIDCKIYDDNPENVSVDMDDEGIRNILQSFYLELS